MEETSAFFIEASKLLAELNKNQQNSINTISLSVREKSSKFINLDDSRYLCKWCRNPWSDGRLSFRVRAENVPKWVKLSVNKLSQITSSSKNRKLNSYKSKIGNVVITHCKVCNKITKIRTKNPNNNYKKNEDENELRTNDKEIEIKKKKKKKDIYAGLKIKKIFEQNNIKTKIKKPNFMANNVEETSDKLLNVCLEKLEERNINKMLNDSVETKENFTFLEKHVQSTLNKTLENKSDKGKDELCSNSQANILEKKKLSIKKSKNCFTNSSEKKSLDSCSQNLKPVMDLKRSNKLNKKKKHKLQLLKKVTKSQTSDLKDFINSL